MNNFILKAQIKINGEIMKKVLLSILIVLVAVTMIGCNNKTSKAITNLKNEIESIGSYRIIKYLTNIFNEMEKNNINFIKICFTCHFKMNFHIFKKHGKIIVILFNRVSRFI